MELLGAAQPHPHAAAGRGGGMGIAPSAPGALAPAVPPAAAAAPQLSPESLRLLTPRWEFSGEAAAKALSDSGTDFRVIGVLGSQGAGKSTLLNALLMDTPAAAAIAAAALGASNASSNAAAGGGGPAGGRGAGGLAGMPFGVAGVRQLAAGQHCTSTLELRVHPGERLLLLDTPPLWSASHVAELMSVTDLPHAHVMGAVEGRTVLGSALADARLQGLPALPAEGAAELLGLQLGAALLAACHVVVLMVEAVDEPRLWEYLQVIDMVAHTLPDVAGASHGASLQQRPQGPAGPQPDAPRGLAELVVVLCGADPDDMSVRQLGPQAALLREALRGGRLLSRHDHVNILRHWGCSKLDRAQQPAAASSSAEAQPAAAEGAEGGEGASRAAAQGAAAPEPPQHLNFWALPYASPTSRSGVADLPHLQPLRSGLLSMPRRPLAHPPPSTTPPASSLPQSSSAAPPPPAGPPLSEREWLRGLERAWGELQRSPGLERYCLARQRAAFAGGGGWALAAR